MRYLPHAALLCLLLTLSTAANAHKSSDSFLQLTASSGQLDGHWDIALRDLEIAVGLDRDRDGQITRGELRAAASKVTAHALARLRFSQEDEICTLSSAALALTQHSDGTYARLPLHAQCPGRGDIELRYALLFNVDANHRGLLRFGDGELAQTFVLSPDQPTATLRAAARPALAAFAEYLWQGVWHIWIGADHILFLLTLLMPAVLLRRAGRWQGQSRGRAALGETLKVVTAFSLAHSITLSLAVLDWVSLPARWVEVAIALSVLLTALNNLWPLFATRWRLAFVFGFIHGFGFANVLLDLGLSDGALAISLAGFNLGVELGQLAIVAGVFPIAWALRHRWLYRVGVLRAGSAAAALMALGWILERAYGYDLPGW